MTLTAYLATLKQSPYGIAAIITELAVLGGVFLYGSNKREKERRDRAELMTKQKQADQKDKSPDSPPKRPNSGKR